MKGQALLALTSHGNAPYLMAVRLAAELGRYDVVLPQYYGERQAAILREEVRGMQERIYLSAELGRLFQPLLLESLAPRGFARAARDLTDPRNPANLRRIENDLTRLLQDGIPACALDGSDRRRFVSADFAAVINTALPLRVDLPRAIFYFTCRLSSLYRAVPEAADADELQAASDLAGLARAWNAVEDTFDLSFVPRINALSHCSADHPGEGVQVSPPFAATRPPIRKLGRPSVLLVPSGTRTDSLKLRRIATTLPEDLQILVLSSSGSHPDFTGIPYRAVGAEVYGDPDLLGVISRGGWGTLWECLANRKPSAMVRTSYLEDPEAGHSQDALKSLGLATILDDSAAKFLEPACLAGLEQALSLARAEDEAAFGTEAADGFAFIAGRLRRDYDL